MPYRRIYLCTDISWTPCVPAVETIYSCTAADGNIRWQSVYVCAATACVSVIYHRTRIHILLSFRVTIFYFIFLSIGQTRYFAAIVGNRWCTCAVETKTDTKRSVTYYYKLLPAYLYILYFIYIYYSKSNREDVHIERHLHPTIDVEKVMTQRRRLI